MVTRTGKVKIYDPLKRTKFSVRQMHNVSQKFTSVATLRSAIWHEFGDAVPDEGKFSVGYFEGKQHTIKWLVTCQDLYIMYNYFVGKPCINLWCDGRVVEEDNEEAVARKNQDVKAKKDKRKNLMTCFSS